MVGLNSAPRPRVQILDLSVQHHQLANEIQSAIQSVIDSSQFIQGEEVDRFSSSLSKYLGGHEVITCANGTDALQLAYMALGLQPGDEVILPTFNYVAAAEAACLLGLKPVFVDSCSETFQILPSNIVSAIGPKTRAIVAVHLFGQGCDMKSLMEISEQYGIPVIEDNAQSLGAFSNQEGFKGKALGTIGTIGTTSFFPSKNLGCMGDGGALFCSNSDLIDKIKMLRNHGQKVRYRYECVGINSRLDAIQAAILSVKLPFLNQFCEKRIDVANRYNQMLSEIPEIVTPKVDKLSSHVFHQYTIKLKNKEIRNELQAWLAEWGVQSIIYYPVPLHTQPAYRNIAQNGWFPIAEMLSGQVLSLPIYPELTHESQDYVVECTKQFFKKRAAG